MGNFRSKEETREVGRPLYQADEPREPVMGTVEARQVNEIDDKFTGNQISARLRAEGRERNRGVDIVRELLRTLPNDYSSYIIQNESQPFLLEPGEKPPLRYKKKIKKLGDIGIAELRQAFEAFDWEKDGTIRGRYLGKVLSLLDQPVPSEMELQDMINKVDVDGNGLIDFKGFVSLMGKTELLGSLGKSGLERLSNETLRHIRSFTTIERTIGPYNYISWIPQTMIVYDKFINRKIVQPSHFTKLFETQLYRGKLHLDQLATGPQFGKMGAFYISPWQQKTYEYEQRLIKGVQLYIDGIERDMEKQGCQQRGTFHFLFKFVSTKVYPTDTDDFENGRSEQVIVNLHDPAPSFYFSSLDDLREKLIKYLSGSDEQNNETGQISKGIFSVAFDLDFMRNKMEETFLAVKDAFLQNFGLDFFTNADDMRKNKKIAHWMYDDDKKEYLKKKFLIPHLLEHPLFFEDGERFSMEERLSFIDWTDIIYTRFRLRVQGMIRCSSEFPPPGRQEFVPASLAEVSSRISSGVDFPDDIFEDESFSSRRVSYGDKCGVKQKFSSQMCPLNSQMKKNMDELNTGIYSVYGTGDRMKTAHLDLGWGGIDRGRRSIYDFDVTNYYVPEWEKPEFEKWKNKFKLLRPKDKHEFENVFLKFMEANKINMLDLFRMVKIAQIEKTDIPWKTFPFIPRVTESVEDLRESSWPLPTPTPRVLDERPSAIERHVRRLAAAVTAVNPTQDDAASNSSSELLPGIDDEDQPPWQPSSELWRSRRAEAGRATDRWKNTILSVMLERFMGERQRYVSPGIFIPRGNAVSSTKRKRNIKRTSSRSVKKRKLTSTRSKKKRNLTNTRLKKKSRRGK